MAFNGLKPAVTDGKVSLLTGIRDNFARLATLFQGGAGSDTTIPTNAKRIDNDGKMYYWNGTAWVAISTVSDTAYGVGWNGETAVAPSQNAVYDKIEALNTAIGSAITGVHLEMTQVGVGTNSAPDLASRNGAVSGTAYLRMKGVVLNSDIGGTAMGFAIEMTQYNRGIDVKESTMRGIFDGVTATLAPGGTLTLAIATNCKLNLVMSGSTGYVHLELVSTASVNTYAYVMYEYDIL